MLIFFFLSRRDLKEPIVRSWRLAMNIHLWQLLKLCISLYSDIIWLPAITKLLIHLWKSMCNLGHSLAQHFSHCGIKLQERPAQQLDMWAGCPADGFRICLHKVARCHCHRQRQRRDARCDKATPIPITIADCDSDADSVHAPCPAAGCPTLFSFYFRTFCIN